MAVLRSNINVAVGLSVELPGRLRSCRRPPLLLLSDQKDPNYRNNNRLKGLGNYSERPKVADAVIEAVERFVNSYEVMVAYVGMAF